MMGVGASAPAFCEGGTNCESEVEERVTVYEKERQLQHELEERIAAGAPDVEVLAVELAGAERFCVYIDHPSGVDHALCERVTGLLRSYLDRYTIDVSSPGSERPLRSRPHFEAAVGRRALVRTAEEIDGRTRFRGEVTKAGEEKLSLQLDGGTVDIPYAAIVRANLIDEGR
jgi:ribosome maturation factor RimP